MSTDLWQRGCERLASELPEQQFNTWIRPLAPVPRTPDGDAGPAGVATAGVEAVVAVQVPNRFKLEWIRSQYSGRIGFGGCATLGHRSRQQRADPGVELLFRQFGSEQLAATLPQI